MNKIKKLMITLVALLAVTTGAWADVTWSLSGSTLTVSGTGAIADYVDYSETPWYDNSDEIKTIVIESGVTSIGNNAFSCTYLESVSIPASVTSIGFSAFTNCGSEADAALTVSFAEGTTPLTIGAGAFENANLKSIDIPNRVTSIGGYAFYGCNNLESVSIPASVTSIGEEAFSSCGKLANVYIYAPNLTTYGANAFAGNAAGRKIYVPADAVDTYKAGWSAYAADIEAIPGSASASSGPEVAWTAASKTGSFTMPGGNVTLEPDYYPQAAVADGGVTAADADARATTEDPLVKVDATKLTGAKKLMYFVSNSGTTPAYDAEGWTDQLPTAEGFTQQGIVYVWYYPVGIDEGVDGATATYSDGDICLQSITARIAAAPAPDLSHTLADGSYYVKNGALSLYMAAGGSYGTHGIVNERGLDLIFTYNSGTKTYTIDSRLDNGGNNHFLNSGLYMDAPSFGWTVEGENSFTISANLDGVKNYLAVDENNNLVYTEDGTAENAQWIIIPKADNENAVLAAGLDAMKAATAENGVDATFLIACPGFNRNDKRNAEAWTVEANQLAMGGGGSEGNGCAESYHSTFTLSQTLSNAPAGVYTLTAQGFYQQNGSDNENLPYFYANDEKQTFKLLEDQVYNMEGAGPLFTQGKYTIDPITVVVAEDGALTIGAKLETNTQLWSCWDNFKLTYYGPVMYAVTFADDTAEPTLWTASPNADVKKGQTVTVTYTGSKKVIGVKAEKKAKAASSVSFTVKRVDHKHADGNYTVAPGTTWQQFIESGDAPACLSIGTSGNYNGKVCHDMDGGLTCCGGTLIANVADKKRVKASDAIIDGATYGCSDYCDYEDHD